MARHRESGFVAEYTTKQNDIITKLQTKNDQLKGMVSELIEEVKKRANAGSWHNDRSVYELVQKYEQQLKRK